MAISRRFDIWKLELRQYRSIEACDVQLGPLSLVVGPNGSGKSNFVDSLRFVAQALNESLDNALRERGGVGEVRRRSGGRPTHLGVEVFFNGDDFSGQFGFQVGAAKGGDFKVTYEHCYVMGPTGTFHYEIRGGKVQASAGVVVPKVTDDRLLLVALSGQEAFRPVFDGLAGINVFSLNPDSMRALQKPDAGDLLKRDGSNVASVLDQLRRSDPALKTRIEDYLRLIVPGIESVARRNLGGWETLEFRQRSDGASSTWTFPATSMSDGTLRVLGILVALFAPSGPDLAPVVIEEPETALHPAGAGLLLDAIRSASRTRQVIATTHSPDLLDSPDLRPEEIIAVRSDGGRSVIARLDAPGFAAIRESLYTPGELLRVDQLQPAEPHNGTELSA
ncbi:AAA family ATPase [Nocardioides sp. NPDC023903]|uniref:AAA family ATPase n=1 Tax=Nocardioides sp. NPDC023903 TaxID=3157195 RepID=UPI0033DA257E